MSELNTLEILERGMNCLYENLGTVETERFISFVIREKFDYTVWRKDLFGNSSIHEINEDAAEYLKNNPFFAKKELQSLD